MATTSHDEPRKPRFGSIAAAVLGTIFMLAAGAAPTGFALHTISSVFQALFRSPLP